MSHLWRFHPLPAVVCVLVLMLCASPLRADVLYLANGATVEGKVTRIEGGYRVETPVGKSLFHDHQVIRVERKQTPDEIYFERRDALAPDDFEGHIELGLWCRKNAMPDRAKWHLMLAVALRPEDGRARLEAGYVRHEGQWITREESKKRQGLRLYQGRWIPVGEAERREAADRQEHDQDKAFGAIWSRLRAAARDSDQAALDPHVEAILPHAADGLAALERGSFDASDRVRRISARTLGRMQGGDSLRVLMRRLELERESNVLRDVLRAFPERQDRDAVLRELLDRTINHPASGVRRRCWTALEALADKRAIDTLIPLVEHEAYLRGAVRPDDEEQGGNEGDPSISTKPYYPVHDALLQLTGERLPIEVKAWETWWDFHRDTFLFRGQKPPEKTKPIVEIEPQTEKESP